MWQDPIVNETRRLREQYAEKFHHDPDANFEDIQKRQQQPDRKFVSLSARKPAFKQHGTYFYWLILFSLVNA